ncbi:hypothetical protein [Bradyrhizobium sp. CCBAU 51765]|uniref:hypothetical protein n=1 Tax=Bradyrhizobium sp. CCBAU 51765 TaxID=1325102 RepID=UPI00188884E7|nr:hypothetical protein [Bradyrhizobium sp. CCBAU 51765]QOZ09898.1 hypothetical protein XH96_21955 [Bradyrhizobium sp. CCBAU 51765]
MTHSRRAFLAIALFAVACTLGAPSALAGSPVHVPDPRVAVHPERSLRQIDRHLPNIRQAQPRQPVEDPLADLILG